jgi:hypothetical protein
MPEISALGRPRWEDHGFKASLGYIVNINVLEKKEAQECIGLPKLLKFMAAH